MSRKSWKTKLEELYADYSTHTMGLKDLRYRTDAESMCLAYHPDFKKEGELRLNYLPDDQKVCLSVFYPDGKVSTVLWYDATPKQVYEILNRSDFLKMDGFLTDLTINYVINHHKRG